MVISSCRSQYTNPKVEPESRLNEFESRLKSVKSSFYWAPRLKSWNIKYNFRWNQPYLSHVSNLSLGSNSLTLASIYTYSNLNLKQIIAWAGKKKFQCLDAVENNVDIICKKKKKRLSNSFFLFSLS